MATFKAVHGSKLSKKSKADGTYTVFIRVTQNRKSKYFSTDYSVKEKDWNHNPREGDDGVLKYVRKSHPSHKKINHVIADKIEEMRDKIDTLSVKTPERIRAVVKDETDDNSFLAFYEKRLEVFRANPNSYRKWKRYNSVYSNLKKFLQGKDLHFSDLTYDFIDEYRNYRVRLGRNENTDFKKMSPVLEEAIRRGLHVGPNLLMKAARDLKRKGNRKETLTIAELEKIKQLPLPEGELIWHSRNLFLLNFYFHGMRIGDSLVLSHDQIQEGRVYYQMEKNGKTGSFKIPTDAYQFLDYYLDSQAQPNQYVFPFLDDRLDYTNTEVLEKQLESKTALVNKYLKKIAKKAEIEKHITTHVARHTFASFARDKIGDISVIQKFLRHSSIRETEIYLSELTDTSLDESTDEIFG